MNEDLHFSTVMWKAAGLTIAQRIERRGENYAFTIRPTNVYERINYRTEDDPLGYLMTEAHHRMVKVHPEQDSSINATLKKKKDLKVTLPGPHHMQLVGKRDQYKEPHAPQTISHIAYEIGTQDPSLAEAKVDALQFIKLPWQSE
ncbi:MAG: hypothetical protein Q9162_002024 [Coniocarpon cinnabarinum]